MRLPTDGPTVYGIHATLYGLIAVIVGRGFHALVSVLPLILGAAMGAGLARRRTVRPNEGTRGQYARRAVAAVAALAVAGLAAALARPASTEATTASDGTVRSGSIAELTSVDVNGHQLGMMIRGHSTDNPVLLFLAGGPGGAERGAMRNHLPELERHFTVATWDQRGTGRSYPQLDPTATYTLDNAVADTIGTTDYLRQRFGQNKVYLLGQSWGSILGVLAVQQQPDLYAAFIGTGQMVSPLATDRIFYEDTVEWARDSGNTALVEQLPEIGSPPYDRMLNYETALTHEYEVYPYDHTGNSEGQGGFSENFVVPEYALIDQIHLLGAFMDSFSVLYPQIQDVDLRTDATTLPVRSSSLRVRTRRRGARNRSRSGTPACGPPARSS